MLHVLSPLVHPLLPASRATCRRILKRTACWTRATWTAPLGMWEKKLEGFFHYPLSLGSAATAPKKNADLDLAGSARTRRPLVLVLGGTFSTGRGQSSPHPKNFFLGWGFQIRTGRASPPPPPPPPPRPQLRTRHSRDPKTRASTASTRHVPPSTRQSWSWCNQQPAPHPSALPAGMPVGATHVAAVPRHPSYLRRTLEHQTH
jgi:hypothetical protein